MLYYRTLPTMRPLALALLLIAPACAPESYPAKVVGISDGDTLTVLRGREQVRVRLHGIDCPESRQDFGTRARQLAADLAFGEVVTVEPVDTDRYGRIVAVVTLPDGRTLNHELVKAGLAWWYRRYAPDDRTLAALEAEARAARLGLWSQPEPTPPWEWRNPTLTGDLAEAILGNRNSHVYHAPGCRNAAKIAERNRVVLESAEAAEDAGYRPGGCCHR